MGHKSQMRTQHHLTILCTLRTLILPFKTLISHLLLPPLISPLAKGCFVLQFINNMETESYSVFYPHQNYDLSTTSMKCLCWYQKTNSPSILWIPFNLTFSGVLFLNLLLFTWVISFQTDCPISHKHTPVSHFKEANWPVTICPF